MFPPYLHNCGLQVLFEVFGHWFWSTCIDSGIESPRSGPLVMMGWSSMEQRQ